MKWIWITFAFLFSHIFQTSSIQNRIRRPIRFTDSRPSPSRHFRHIDTSTYGVSFDWEHGLREAMIQALFKEHYGDSNLRKHIHSAPLLGKQDKATPFGDIAILARGQLYANYAGFIFVQDPYQNDCDNCHNIDVETTRGRCINNHCQIWHPRKNDKLLALWTIKRIRHRSLHGGPTYEVEFTIAPVGLRYQNGPYLTNEGTFNYNLPGHVFVLKSSETNQHLKTEPNVNNLRNGAFIAQSPDGRKLILHSFPGLLTPESPRYYYELPPKHPLHTPILTSTPSTTEYSEEDEKKIYQTLLEVLHKKTSPESTRFTPTPKSTSTLADTTLVQLPGGQIFPIRELETPFITKTTPGYVTVRFPESTGIQAVPEEHRTTSLEPTQGQTVATTTSNRVTPQIYGMIRPQMTSNSHRTTGFYVPTTHQQVPTNGLHTTTDFHTTFSEGNFHKPQNPPVVYTEPRPLYTTPNVGTDDQTPQTLGTTQDMTKSTKNPPIKTTFHYFAAEEDKKTTEDIFKKPLTTVQQDEYTEYENFLPDTLVPTQPTRAYASESAITESKTIKETSIYPTSSEIFTLRTTSTSYGPSTEIKKATKYPKPSYTKPFTSKFPSTDYKPASVVKVTKPIEKTTKTYASTYTTSKTTQVPEATEPSTKITPFISILPSTSYSSTSKQPESTFKVPITVLEESTFGSTTEQQSKYPTTHLEQLFTITQSPTITYTEPKIPVESTKYTTVQFPYSSTKTINPIVEEGTTLSQTTFTNMKTTGSTGETTVYTKIPTKESEKAAVETTVGVTKIMATSQNKTTEMIYYTAEETEAPTKLTNYNKVTTQTTLRYAETTEPTNRISVPKTETPTTPKRIITSTGADGIVSVKSTSISADEELFGATKSTPKTTVKPKSTTESGEFLVDGDTLDANKVPLYKKPLTDYSEDDIFGGTKKTYTKTSKKPTKPYTKSDIEKALFDTNRRKPKSYNLRKSSTTSSLPKVIYSDFFEASTIPMTTETPTSIAPTAIVTPAVPMKTARITKVTRPPRKSFSLAKKNKFSYVTTESAPMATIINEDDQITPVTSQSYLTSISYEVNKRKKISYNNLKSSKYKPNNSDTMDQSRESSPTSGTSVNTKISDTSSYDFASRLVSQVKGVEYLEQLSTTESTILPYASAKTTKKSKYTRRRTYTSKSKRPTRKKLSVSRET